MKKCILLLQAILLIFSVFLTACETSNRNGNNTESSETTKETEILTDICTTTETDAQTVEQTIPVPYLSEVVFIGSADELVAKMDDILATQLRSTVNPFVFVIDSEEGISALAQIHWRDGFPEFNQQLYNKDFFKSGFILITIYCSSSISYKYEIKADSYDIDSIIMNKIQTYPTLSQAGEMLIFEPASDIYIVYHAIPIPYNKQIVYFINTQVP